jgi:hypothetical protein
VDNPFLDDPTVLAFSCILLSLLLMEVLNSSLTLMRQILRIRYQEALDQSNYGTITVMTEIQSGQ